MSEIHALYSGKYWQEEQIESSFLIHSIEIDTLKGRFVIRVVFDMGM